jgi:hypothetical protein
MAGVTCGAAMRRGEQKEVFVMRYDIYSHKTGDRNKSLSSDDVSLLIGIPEVELIDRVELFGVATALDHEGEPLYSVVFEGEEIPGRTLLEIAEAEKG